MLSSTRPASSILFTAILCCATNGPLLADGRILVEITGAEGQAITNATVRFYGLPEFARSATGALDLAPGAPPTSRSFDLSSNDIPPLLPTGRYIVCVTAVGFLDPCEWGYGPPIVVGPDGRDVRYRVTIEKGAQVLLVLRDPHRIVARSNPLFNNGGVINGGVIVGVQRPDGDGSDPDAYTFHQAARLASVGDRITYGITVPRGRGLNLWIFSRDIVIEDHRGVRLPLQGARIPFSAGAETDAIEFELSAVGRVQE